MITHTWIIDNLECVPVLSGFENIVKKVRWILNSSNGITLASTNGTTDLGFNPDTSEFRSYDTLDQQTVIGWLHDELTAGVVTGFQQAHETILSRPLEPEVITLPLPWATA